MMSQKSKGMNVERELLHMFWAKRWGCIRVAGSGSMRYPSADILAANKKRLLAIECKGSKKKIKYIDKDDIEQLEEFSNLFNAEPFVGVKFNRCGWFFVKPKQLKEKGNMVLPKKVRKFRLKFFVLMFFIKMAAVY